MIEPGAARPTSSPEGRDECQGHTTWSRARGPRCAIFQESRDRADLELHYDIPPTFFFDAIAAKKKKSREAKEGQAAAFIQWQTKSSNHGYGIFARV
jgi:hypothetical protein